MNEQPHTRDPKPYWLDNPKNVDKVYWSVIVSCAALFLLDAFYEKHPEFEMEKIFGFYGLYGFVACVGLVIAAKELRKLLMRDEDYYDREGRD
jgi:hypothetical protein